MLWFGGVNGPAACVPVDARNLWDHVSSCWSVGMWPTHQIHVTQSDRRALAVVGPCGITVEEFERLAIHDVPDDVAWRWAGSYTIVQVTDQGTTIWTDVGGAWPIYTTSAHGAVYWSSSSRALAGLTGAQPDADWLAAWLLAPGVPALLDGRSSFTGISRVPCGHRLFLPTGGAPTSQPVWRPRPRSGDHAARLRAELAAAVAVRVDSASAPTVDLSGGYDSTALALLAAHRLHPDRTVTGVTLHPEGVTVGGDVSYACQAAKYPGIVHRLMPLSSRHAPYSNLHAVPATDEPAPSTISHKHFSVQLQWMRAEFGSDCHLTGDGGDSLVCSPTIMLADLMAARWYRRTLAETIGWARLRRLAVWSLLVDAYRTARITREDAFRTLARRWRTGYETRTVSGIGWVPDVTIPQWSTVSSRERAANLAVTAADGAGRIPVAEAAVHVTSEVMAGVGRTARADTQLAECHGVPLHNPFTDSRVIDAYLSVPLNERPGPAEYKPIMRDAFADLFPPSLAARRTKGSFTADYYQGMRANLSVLHDLTDGRLAQLGLVNPAALRHTLTAVAAGVPVAFSAVEPAIAAEVWLRVMDASPVVAWRSAQTVRGTG
ncbi:MAG: albusnodin/ikarugamycin family macrolactam cyclase [Pseudonocardiales bacterium]